MAASDLPTVLVVDGACPFDKGLLPPKCTATPATHFALAAGPASDTAVLLPFAQHRWHSRLVAALRDDARETHGGDLSTAAAFVLVALPEQARPKVFDLLVEVLELRREDRQSETGLPDTISDSYVALVVELFPLVKNIRHLDFSTVASLCQLCRLSEFIQLSIGVDLACSYIAPWVEHVHTSELQSFLPKALESACREDHVVGEVASHVKQSGRLTPDQDLLDKLHAQNVSRYLGRAPAGRIPKMFLDVLPPGVIPAAVLDSRMQCYLSAGTWLPVYCGASPGNTQCQLYVTAATAGTNQWSDAVFGCGPRAVASLKRLCGNPTSAQRFVSLRLPSGLAAGDFEELNGIQQMATHFIAAHDMDDGLLAALVPRIPQATIIDLSQSVITHVPELCFSPCTNLSTVHLPATVETIGDFAFPGKVSLITGVGPDVQFDSATFPHGCAVSL